MRTAPDQRVFLILLDDLAQFRKDYLFTGQIAAVVPSVGYHAKAVLEKMGIAPAAKLGNRHIWRKADIDGLACVRAIEIDPHPSPPSGNSESTT